MINTISVVAPCIINNLCPVHSFNIFKSELESVAKEFQFQLLSLFSRNNNLQHKQREKFLNCETLHY